MKESRQKMLRQNFNMFDYIPGETLEAQLQRFTTLTTEMCTTGIYLNKGLFDLLLTGSGRSFFADSVRSLRLYNEKNTLTWSANFLFITYPVVKKI